MRVRRVVGAVVAVVVVSALGPAGEARAARVMIGSDLSASATIADPWPVDTAFWQTALAGGGGLVSPVKGQAIIVKLKGTALPTAGAALPLAIGRFQVLRPQAGGGYGVVVTSEDFDVPVGGDPNQVSTYTSAFLCVEAGDVIAFSHSGGYDAAGYPQGTPFQVFGAVPGSTTQRFTGAGKDNNGDAIAASATDTNRELLMQVVIGSGPDARPACGGTSSSPTPGKEPPAGPGGGGSGGGGSGGGGGGSTPTARLTVPADQRNRVNRKHRVKVELVCERARCTGTVKLFARDTTLGRAKFDVAKGTTARVTVTLNTKGRKLLKRAKGTLRAKAIVGGVTKRTLTLRA